jgi:hypothetical protein
VETSTNPKSQSCSIFQWLHHRNFTSDPAGTSMVRVSLESAQFWSLPDHHRFAPLCGVVITTSLSGRLIRIPSAVPVGVREVWPTRTVRFPLPGSMTTGSAQPSTHLPHRPMWVGIAWKTGPAWEPLAMRSQKSTSDSPSPEVSYRSGRPRSWPYSWAKTPTPASSGWRM